MKFTCPQCDRQHERGSINGNEDHPIFRCLNCGYQGYGFHPDQEIDLAVANEIIENQKTNLALGLPSGPFEP